MYSSLPYACIAKKKKKKRFFKMLLLMQKASVYFSFKVHHFASFTFSKLEALGANEALRTLSSCPTSSSLGAKKFWFGSENWRKLHLHSQSTIGCCGSEKLYYRHTELHTTREASVSWHLLGKAQTRLCLHIVTQHYKAGLARRVPTELTLINIKCYTFGLCWMNHWLSSARSEPEARSGGS